MRHTPSSPDNTQPTPRTGPNLSPARAVVVVAAIVATLALLAPYPATVTAAASELDGKTLFMREKCNLCHSIPQEDIEAKVKSEKMLGPDLPTAEAPEDADLMLDFLRQKAEINGEKHKKAFKGSDEELGALVAWLDGLRDEDSEEAGERGR